MLMLSMASWAATVNTPGASAVITGSYVLNATIDAPPIGQGHWATSCLITASSSLSANLSDTIVNLTNTTTNQTEWNATFVSSTFEDASDYTFLWTCLNTTHQLSANTSRSGITIDNTVPAMATGLTSGTQTSDDVTVSATVTDAQTTGCSIEWEGTNSITPLYPSGTAGTYSGSSCSVSFSNLPDNTYSYRIRTTDGRDTTATEYVHFKVAEDKTSAAGSSAPSVSITEKVSVPTSSDLKDATTKTDSKISAFLDAIGEFFKNLFN